jgi:hypothetical protein
MKTGDDIVWQGKRLSLLSRKERQEYRQEQLLRRRAMQRQRDRSKGKTNGEEKIRHDA